MQIKYTQAMLDKLEKILDEAGYVLRYERGNFNSGYCILEHKKVVVVNKFLNVEGRINTLLDILPLLEVQDIQLSEASSRLYEQLVKEKPTTGE